MLRYFKSFNADRTCLINPMLGILSVTAAEMHSIDNQLFKRQSCKYIMNFYFTQTLKGLGTAVCAPNVKRNFKGYWESSLKMSPEGKDSGGRMAYLCKKTAQYQGSFVDVHTTPLVYR